MATIADDWCKTDGGLLNSSDLVVDEALIAWFHTLFWDVFFGGEPRGLDGIEHSIIAVDFDVDCGGLDMYE
jgi:hypothetical protein